MPQLRSSTAVFSNQKRALFCTCVRNLLENNNISIAFLCCNQWLQQTYRITMHIYIVLYQG